MKTHWIIIAVLACALGFFFGTRLLYGESYGELRDDGQYSIIGLWHLNDNSSSESDSSGNSNTATVTGAAYTTTTAKFGGAYYFDGVSGNDYLDIDTINGEFNSTQGTFAVWVYRTFADDTSARKRLAEFHHTSDNDRILLLYNQTYDEWRFNYVAGGTGNNISLAPSKIPQNEWTSVVVVWDISGDENKFFVNGYEEGNLTSLSGSISATLTVSRIGSNDTNYLNWEGYMDEICIWDRALSDDEIRAIYHMQRGGFGIIE